MASENQCQAAGFNVSSGTFLNGAGAASGLIAREFSALPWTRQPLPGLPASGRAMGTLTTSKVSPVAAGSMTRLST